MPEIKVNTKQTVKFSSEELVAIMTAEAQRALGAKAIGGLAPAGSYEIIGGHVASMTLVFDMQESA